MVNGVGGKLTRRRRRRQDEGQWCIRERTERPCSCHWYDASTQGGAFLFPFVIYIPLMRGERDSHINYQRRDEDHM
jgi:hypothetical protein